MGSEMCIRDRAIQRAKEVADKDIQKFAIVVGSPLLQQALDTWIIQLFEESLGSKKDGFYPRTIVVADKSAVPEDFTPVEFQLPTDDPLLRMMALTYLLEVFVADISRRKEINFVNQPQVELYKKKTRELMGRELMPLAPIEIGTLKDRIQSRLKVKPETRFIDVVLYGEVSGETLERIRGELQERFKGQLVQVFIGSDWNHHSYQAAVQDPNTLFVILTKDYVTDIEGFDRRQAQENLHTLKVIAEATYETLKDKAIYCKIKISEIVAEEAIPLPSVRDYLKEVKERLPSVLERLADSKEKTRVVFVLGHSNPDEDAITSTIAKAYLEAVKHQGEDVLFVPLVNGTVNYRARQLMDENNIPPELLTGYTGIADRLKTLGGDSVAREKMSLMLVDHNELELDGLKGLNIIEILDHHPLKGEAVPVEKVGASATLIKEQFIKQNIKMPEELARLLLGAILFDTLNFASPTATPRDQEMAGRLAAQLKVNRDEFYHALASKVFDTSGRTPQDLLEDDLKELILRG